MSPAVRWLWCWLLAGVCVFAPAGAELAPVAAQGYPSAAPTASPDASTTASAPSKNWLIGYALFFLAILLTLVPLLSPRPRKLLSPAEEEQRMIEAEKRAAQRRAEGLALQKRKMAIRRQHQPTPSYAGGLSGRTGAKSRTTAGMLGIFLGGWGAHWFYLGDSNKAVLRILATVCCGFGGIWGMIEGIQILTGGIDTDADGRPLI